jgi:hypothetical protein
MLLDASISFAGAAAGYGWLRLVHGYWRWMVCFSALVVLVRALSGAARGRPWSAGDERAAVLFVAAVDLQVLLGLTLYFGFSPYWSATHTAFAATMKNQGARFFGVEHETAMLLAFITAHVGRALAKRAPSDTRKQRIMRTTLLVFFAIIAWAIPWPWRSFGRPLLRTTL